MKIGIISDSHDVIRYLDAALEFFKEQNCKILVHAGDFCSPFAVNKLLDYDGQIYSVMGNNDGDHEMLRSMFANKKEKAQLGTYAQAFNVNDKEFIIVHGHIPFFLEALIKSQDFDIIITGHTHVAQIIQKDGVLVINPGSSAGYVTDQPTIAVLDTENWEASIHDLEE